MIDKTMKVAIRKAAERQARIDIAKSAPQTETRTANVAFPAPFNIRKSANGVDGFSFMRLFCALASKDESQAPLEMASVRKAMSTTSDQDGGYLVEEEHSALILDVLDKQAVLRTTGATIRPMSTGKMNISGTSTLARTAYEGENIDLTEGSPGTRRVILDAKSLLAFVQVSNQELADAGPRTEKALRNNITKAIGRKETLESIVGTGGVGITGFLNMPDTVDIVSDGIIVQPTKTTILVEDIQALLTTVEEAESEATAFMTTPTLYNQCRLIKDNENRPILTNALNSSGKMQRHLLDVPVVVTNAAKVGTTHYMFALDWEGECVIGQRSALSFAMSSEAGFGSNSTFFRAELRHDVQLLHQDAMAYMAVTGF